MKGKIAQADGGTLFLDEIGDMPLELQTRLLRVLEERQVQPLGSDVSVPVDICLISATHCDLLDKIAQGAFREDLYYRINGLTLALPALRERQDKAELIRRVLAAEGQADVDIAEDAFRVLSNYPWPGNLRQLRNTLRTAAALCEGGLIRLEDLDHEIAASALAEGGEPPSVEPDQASPLDSAERQALIDELSRQKWNVSRAAVALGVSRNTLYRKMRKHGIGYPRPDQ
ncbi:sigma-54-dependent Fis family transcriptional regulator [Alkalilimnicola ehrlichii]|uniref:sigma-54-dependent Fis family transcriptional regulator n=1 Tax=Alkalilimnicola ehrlichii TaxID=351052 RepID=UPI001C6DFA55|nr:sigma 54-interacting transcriptional regulator [Alkalilimnicola ehrlichii]